MTWTNPAWDWLRLKRSSGRDALIRRVRPVSQDLFFAGLEQDIILARYRATNAAEFSIQITQILRQMTQNSGLNALLLAKLVTPDSRTVGIDDPFFALTPQHLREVRHILGAWAILTRGLSLALDIGECVRRQHLWDQIGDLSNGGFLAHRNPKESENEPEILHASLNLRPGVQQAQPQERLSHVLRTASGPWPAA